MRRVFLFISFEVVARGLGVVLDLVAQGGGVGEAALVADEVVELHPHAVVVEAVSYTHLDVYKRQVTSVRGPSRMGMAHIFIIA